VDQAAHPGFLQRLRHGRVMADDSSWPASGPSDASEYADVHAGIHLRGAARPPASHATGLGAAALPAPKPSTPAAGSMATPPLDLVVGCAPSRWTASQPKDVLIGSLKAAIRKIEGHASQQFSSADAVAHPPLDRRGWSLGCTAIDRLLPHGLESGALHEVKASPHISGASAGDWLASFGFALRLAVRRALVLQTNGPRNASPWLLWCCPHALSAEYGVPSAAGLAALGIDPGRFVIVETARAPDALVALEDGLRSSSLALAFGILDDIALTPARRLSLAAQASGTPCLLLTHPASEASAATATRWSVRREASAPHAFDDRASGQTRFSVSLERCRARPQSCQQRALSVEWCDETRTFSLASSMADRALGADQSRRRAKG
jgi:protein ImuA